MMTSSTTPSPSATVLGLGGCLDYETVWDSAVMTGLARDHGIGRDDLVRGDVIETERDLVRSILAFVRDGVGGERAVASHDVVEAVAGRHERRVTLGGTSVRAALAMSAVGIPSTLHLVAEDDHVRALLPDDVEYICSRDADAINPHLIMQFPAGARVELADGTVVESQRANRLIYVCDPPNREMALADELGDLLATAQVFLISGFNSMTDQPMLVRRMRELRDAMERLPAEATVVFEDGGYHVPGFERIVIDAITDRVDVYGMNEDELQAYVGRPVDLLDPVDVAAALRRVRTIVPARTLVVHTQHWALAHGTAAATMAAALEGGIDMASARYLHGDGLDIARLASVREVPRQSAGEEFSLRLAAMLGTDVACVAARELVTDAPTTIGLGDAFVGGLVASLATGVAQGRSS
ncbi:ADP-dependent glucokinase/phosphofructokinase [Demequina muriae]|uniref:ADP-dependent glucokinase/phosphofructokinase n=1 Tax=Demequina muriae TaxID=3051664 RepID=A0ABT8GE99_9MICO|nr:ADP-dependent glucokinase/phosphofructokinase [Demequina sp. EGI L300058]MDN4479747.1 ADP-dependent glucokinase/phosphofructokinase [Demequina sp. EGI L300058]